MGYRPFKSESRRWHGTQRGFEMNSRVFVDRINTVLLHHEARQVALVVIRRILEIGVLGAEKMWRAPA